MNQRLCFLFLFCGFLLGGCQPSDDHSTTTDAASFQGTWLNTRADAPEGVARLELTQTGDSLRGTFEYKTFDSNGVLTSSIGVSSLLGTVKGNGAQVTIYDPKGRKASAAQLTLDGQTLTFRRTGAQVNYPDQFVVRKDTAHAAAAAPDLERFKTTPAFSEDGVDFRASGTNPDWTLAIDFQKMMRFESGDLTLNTPVTKPSLAQDAPVIRYAAHTEQGTLQVTLRPEPCAQQGNELPYRVTVAAKTEAMSGELQGEGCGEYLGNYRLNGKWTLVQVGDTKIDPAQFPQEIPFLEFQLTQGTVTGLAGCNRVRGPIILQGDQLTFGPLMGTKMSCPNMAVEQILTSFLSEQTHTLRFEANRLVLEGTRGNLILTPAS
ncbi:Heat shock protein HslJ [Catalinimonas alkaloidigena]|uniref:Heat shock protein HslJ n=1 Tax=Catalinimonas alkaloidigena TaxID=1075417 RepID=A0A1G9K2Y5_9BACT|nr:META domain-containing protein [Catalinimonas alkaloidigena]SDL43725.1 Heat shock protein HslJ [Catalinimonas alkaloidigena]